MCIFPWGNTSRGTRRSNFDKSYFNDFLNKRFLLLDYRYLSLTLGDLERFDPSVVGDFEKILKRLVHQCMSKHHLFDGGLGGGYVCI